MDLCGRGAIVIEGLTDEMALQHHLCALREDEVIKEADGAGCLVESELSQGGETNPSAGRSGGWLRRVGEANLDEFKRRAPFEEGCQIPNGNFCSRLKIEPCKGGKAEIAKVCAERM